ncbi:MAG: UDP-N-acetylmuramoyl-L-alanyl-D-glutamate--2,6-diaminopimelate ligase, partial [Deltaproteobacteria bacterium]|nr:UDP-N-acetylmuramoyl-L-alanyl-D-glutamate--2,6-diaminopimelate ligase [Deltaproteobacteria bacterium]
MKLSQLSRLFNLTFDGSGDPDVDDVTEDSRSVREGCLFVAVRGQNSDGACFARQAAEKGAAAVLFSRESDPAAASSYLSGPRLVAEESGDEYRALLSRLARAVHRRPDEDLTMIGVTGTNGKSTTTYLLEAVLNAASIPCGVMGTINYRWPGETFEAPNTTPEGPLLWRTLDRMRQAGVKAAIMEVSSHALSLGRLGDLAFDLAIFTNLSRDHLDFHGDMESYFAAKKSLFSRRLRPTTKGDFKGGKLCPSRQMIVCADDEHGRRLLAEFPEALGFGLETETDVVGRNLVLSRAGSSLTIDVRARRETLQGDEAPEQKAPEKKALEKKTAEGQSVEGKTVKGKISKEKTSKENIAEARKGENGGVGNMTLAIRSSVLGRFNALNILGAAAAAAALGLEPRTIEKALSGFAGTPGRLTRVGENSDYLVLADYSHTPEALKVALETLDGLKEDPESRLLCLFGCGGDRDRGKRPLMGRT